MLGEGLARGLINKAIAAAAAAGAAFVAVTALGAAVYFALCLVVTALAAAAITALLFAAAALAIVLVVIRRNEAEEEDEPEGLAQRAFALFRERPVLGAVAAVAGGFIFLKNPALATMVTAAFAEKSHVRRRRR